MSDEGLTGMGDVMSHQELTMYLIMRRIIIRVNDDVTYKLEEEDPS